MNHFLYLVLLLWITSCSTLSRNQEPTFAPDSIDMTLMEKQQSAIDRLTQTDEVGLKVESESTKTLSSIEHKYLINTKTEHPKVQKWIEYYSVKDRERFQRFLNRGAKYKELVQDLFVSNGLPPDLYYLGILESGYVQGAVSRVGAVGPWQFMGPTGRQYGLKINNYVDERVDPIRSTLAAIRYLKELYRQKKSWYLALAAYNAGPGRVRNAMRKARNRGTAENYWNLTKRNLLPYDTREYIPQFLAILYIGKNLNDFKFVEVTEEILPNMELVKVPSPIKLEYISQNLEMSIDELKLLNPHLLKDMTPPGNDSYYLWTHKDKVSLLKDKYDDLANYREKDLKIERSIASYSGRRTIHTVRNGQSLGLIASRHRISLTQLKRMNHLKTNRIYVGQKLKIYSNNISRSQSVVASVKSASVRDLTESNVTIHKVRSGDNLTDISKRYGKSIAQLKSYNNLKSGKIYIGQKLKLTMTEAEVKRYKIKRGDNLSKIAQKFGLSISEIKELNKLKSNKIRRGQYLIIAAKD
jgi:membrane-bound lytic murein transglycosylase D